MHLITLKDWSSEEVEQTVTCSLALKENPGSFADRMSGRNLALLFQKTSTRTRYTGEVGMFQLGGHAIYLDWGATNFALADFGNEIKVLSLYADLLLVRLLKHTDVLKATESSRVPVMNGCCDRYHPLQALADLTTIRETFGRLEGVRLTYVGVRNNVCNSLVAAAIKVGMQMTVVTPEVNQTAEDQPLYQQAREAGLLSETTDLRGALSSSDVVYTDTWIDMEYFDDPEFAAEKERRIGLFRAYQLNGPLLNGLDLRIMHCLPAHRGYEVDGSLLEDPRSVVFQQAQNRLHSQKAAILKLAGKLD